MAIGLRRAPLCATFALLVMKKILSHKNVTHAMREGFQVNLIRDAKAVQPGRTRVLKILLLALLVPVESILRTMVA